MCGICGIVHRDRSYPVSESVLLRMRDMLTHRGPDDAGHHVAPGIGIGSRRLSIVDLSERGRMPMSTPDGRFWITYNGEIYNYRGLRPALEARGHVFRSNTDTEVLLTLYAEEGPAMLDRLNGMFAFAVWDSRERALFLCRDRLGIKPLYYAVRDGALHFASEEKALFAAGIPARFDPGTWEEMLCFRYVAGERTPFGGVARLLPGHYLIWKDGEIRVRRWWNLAERAAAQRKDPPAEPVKWFRETFDSSVSLRRISDVPLGVLLSGGLDSGSVAASLASQAGSGVASFTVRFSEQGFDEGPLAKEVAERWRLDYHQLVVSPEELMGRLSRASWLNDEPVAHASDLHLLAISEYAKPRVTVLLSGEGGDETLGGYTRYRPLRFPPLLDAARFILPPLVAILSLGRRARKLSRFAALGSVDRFVLLNTCDTLPEDLKALGVEPAGRFDFRERVLEEAKSLYPREPLRQAMYSDLHTFLCSILDRNDRMTMGASIECRVPFLDYRMVEGLAALPTSVLAAGTTGKRLLRRAVGDRLPESVRRYRKWGFSVPWRRYLRQVQEFRDLVASLPDVKPIRDGPFDRAALRRTASRFLEGDSRSEELIRQLVMIAVWHRACFPGARQSLEPQHSGSPRS
ncbi:MAG TPA: asparagine synthase (glutamine-hydrolyzing) [Candidatus Polarisedimenticolia bacterium]|nr:asparagine synthase (glutamine-hydrolyzing) [Candidatus Polarisedimenticolia bacterium]